MYPETKDWRVADVREGDVQEVNGRSLQKFYVDFDGAPDTYWRRKAGDLPKIGESYYGTISENQYGLQFKKERREGGGGGAGGNRGGGGGRMRERPASEVAGSRHAHNLLVAAENLQPLAAEPDPDAVDRRIELLDYFAGKLDAQTAAISAEAAGGAEPQMGEGSAPAERQAIRQSNARERGEMLERLLAAHLTPAAINLVVTYALSEMTDTEISAAIERLETEAMAVAAVKRLVERTEAHHGAPLPSQEPEDDIPF